MASRSSTDTTSRKSLIWSFEMFAGRSWGALGTSCEVQLPFKGSADHVEGLIVDWVSRSPHSLVLQQTLEGAAVNERTTCAGERCELPSRTITVEHISLALNLTSSAG
jgi:hypothetical protein